MTEEEKLKNLTDAETEYKWACTVIDDPSTSAIDKEKATKILESQQSFWDDVDDHLDDILDIEDDDEREKAWEAWENEATTT